MKENLTILICFLGFSMGINAQSSIENNNVFYLNVFINANKTIYVEEEKTSFQGTKKSVLLCLPAQ